ncbi:MAG TPA: hypothetical protein VF708_04965 [Pyrinomonadaceae bacterium]|jgi:hypothetical protein
MRRIISIINVLLLALSVSVWGSALAAALSSCPHARGEEPRVKAQDHSCCHARLALEEEEEAQAHCSTPAGRESMGDMQMARAEVAAAPTAEAAFGPSAETCAHCMERSEAPATMPNAFQANQIKRSLYAAASDTRTPLAPLAALYAPQILSRQGSPPGAQPRKHVLISIFLI